ncbi:cysteine desulfurase/selenocysteine lyase [Pedobacter cryoconitis]|uniref:aminotransferase class V-fold PLP-dependent enzyme n=1 Tax=Pedobacter cryoconitis TaxID=188932 RepID=UPI00161D4EEA|nr:SufS family cysteine desulfurase [Pedobacter cryoconitis]MBB6270621.1 cysteine desulfurase/selenocysteine lyase [Pedobacter cryoconitis]
METNLTCSLSPERVEKVRSEFPVLNQMINGSPLIYLDNAATTQKPLRVTKCITQYYNGYNSNVHRGVHQLSQLATIAYEESREKIAGFIHAAHKHEVIYTKGTTDGINMVAYAFNKKFLAVGDTVMISAMEHHANIVPWQIYGEEKEIRLKVIPINEHGELDMDAFSAMLDEKVKLVSVTYVSNTLGTVNPIKDIIRIAHQHGIPVLIDAAQAIAHIAIDVQELDVDFLVFSGHKMYGPTGIGVLYAKEKWLEQMPPYQGGGDMIKQVTFEKTTYNTLPYKFEAGTPSISAAIGLGAAIDYLQDFGIEELSAYEHELTNYTISKLLQVDGLRLIGSAKAHAGSISFIMNGHHNSDIGELLNQQGIAVRTGHHCTQPLMKIFNIRGTVRASLAIYNTHQEIDSFLGGLNKALEILRG